MSDITRIQLNYQSDSIKLRMMPLFRVDKDEVFLKYCNRVYWLKPVKEANPDPLAPKPVQYDHFLSYDNKLFTKVTLSKDDINGLLLLLDRLKGKMSDQMLKGITDDLKAKLGRK
ncbi:MAG: hypothetical protein WC838_04265 [Candidatus Margulisiibacteriota bacterium]|jgi:hypothetical protein